MNTLLHDHADALSVARKCQLLTLSCARAYRLRCPVCKGERNTALRHKMQQIALDMSCYGYRTLTQELKRQGEKVGERRVRRLWSVDRSANAQRCAKIICCACVNAPSWSRPTAIMRCPRTRTWHSTPSAPDQLWRADTSEPVAGRASRSVTYVRLQREFVYVAVVLGAFSRRVIGVLPCMSF